MKAYYNLLLLTFLTSCINEIADGATMSYDQRQDAILSGQPTKPDQFPEVGMLHIVHSVFGHVGDCTGTLIAPDVVLTAAHCLFSSPEDDTTIVFVNTAASEWDSPWAYAKHWVQHPEYLPLRHLRHDIGLIFLNEAQNVPTASLPTYALDENDIGESVELVGYGIYEKSSIYNGWTKKSGKKHQGTSKIAELSPLNIKILGNSEPYYGDSGGPLYANHRGMRELIGITSTGEKHGSAWLFRQPNSSYYTRVDVHQEWIEEQLQQACENNWRTAEACSR